MFAKFQRLLIAGSMVLGLGAGAAQACDGYGNDYHACRYERVVDYVSREVPQTICVTLYDHCGYPYTVHKTIYRVVSVPVVRYVAVNY